MKNIKELIEDVKVSIKEANVEVAEARVKTLIYRMVTIQSDIKEKQKELQLCREALNKLEIEETDLSFLD
jgi:hypothetical protein